jgi:2-amino-4-hydroxy-6-hydroxymethyldihydropteridine diphosphokinase
MSVPVVIALGGNLGDVRATGEAALAQLNDTPGLEVQRSSRWYSTEPVGCDGRFLNAAALLLSELPPTQLLRRLLEIETKHGRVRTGHWTPRPLDLDLILFGQWQIADPRLKLPHPAAWCRRFVLDPACEVAGELVHADFSMTLHQLRDRLLARPLVVAWGAELPLEAVTEGPVQSRFGDQVRWAEAGEVAMVRFVPPSTVSRGQFEVAVPDELLAARRIVIETLTSMLDEPAA